MGIKKDDELNRLQVIARRLERTEKEIAALPDGERERTQDYLYNRFGWFERDDKPVQG